MTFILHKALSLWSTEALLPRLGLCCLSAVNPSCKTPLSFLVFSFKYIGGSLTCGRWCLIITKVFEYPPRQLSACPSYPHLFLIFLLLCLSKCDLDFNSRVPNFHIYYQKLILPLSVSLWVLISNISETVVTESHEFLSLFFAKSWSTEYSFIGIMSVNIIHSTNARHEP